MLKILFPIYHHKNNTLTFSLFYFSTWISIHISCLLFLSSEKIISSCQLWVIQLINQLLFLPLLHFSFWSKFFQPFPQIFKCSLILFFNAEKIIKASYGLLIILGVGSLAALVPLVPGLMQPCLAVLVVGNPWQPWYRLAALVLFVSLGTPCQPWYPLSALVPLVPCLAFGSCL